MDNQDLEKRIKALEDYANKDNFGGVQIFRKKVNVISHLKVPHYIAVPGNGSGGFSVGEIIEVGGKLQICTAASLTNSTFVICGTQT